MLHQYTGPEVSVGRLHACGIKEFTIDEIKQNSEAIASGAIRIMDYIENCGATHKWEAKKIDKEWEIRCNDDPSKFDLIEKNGDKGFTWVSDINSDMKKFIADQLVLQEQA